jgi:hypothetical protein
VLPEQETSDRSGSANLSTQASPSLIRSHSNEMDSIIIRSYNSSCVSPVGGEDVALVDSGSAADVEGVSCDDDDGVALDVVFLLFGIFLFTSLCKCNSKVFARAFISVV